MKMLKKLFNHFYDPPVPRMCVICQKFRTCNTITLNQRDFTVDNNFEYARKCKDYKELDMKTYIFRANGGRLL